MESNSAQFRNPKSQALAIGRGALAS